MIAREKSDEFSRLVEEYDAALMEATRHPENEDAKRALAEASDALDNFVWQ